MEKERPSVTDPHRRNTAEDTTASPDSRPLSRSTVHRAQTPRADRTGDHYSRPGALPPAPGRLLHVLNSPWCPALLVLLLIVITQQVVTDGPLLAVDRWVRSVTLRMVADNPFGALDTLAEWWTDLGSTSIATLLLTCATVVATVRLRSWKPLFSAVMAGLLLFATVIPAKVVIARPGPEGQPVQHGFPGWYPSGHTSTASICLGTAAWLLAQCSTSAQVRRWLALGTTVLCTGVGLTLIWRDYHWFLDVLAGWCLSGTVLWCLFRWSPRARPLR